MTTLKAKATQATQFGDTQHGYNAKMHYTVNAPISFFNNLRDLGYDLDCTEDSDENGYDESVEIFCSFGENKNEFMKQLRVDIKEAQKNI